MLLEGDGLVPSYIVVFQTPFLMEPKLSSIIKTNLYSGGLAPSQYVVRVGVFCCFHFSWK